MKSLTAIRLIAISTAIGTCAYALASGPVAQGTYKVSVFAKSVPGQYTAPDSIAVSHNRVYIGYGNNIAPDGSDGKSSTIVEYTKTGQVTRMWTVKGHNDGLKINPETHELWAMQNEDADPNLVIIATNTPEAAQRVYTFTGKTPHGGGYDDLVFRNGEVYFSASNPANNPNLAPAIVKATFNGNTISVSPFFQANSVVDSVTSESPVTLNLQDPDSMTLDSRGDILLDSQADSELIVVRKPNTPQQSGTVIPLSSPLGTPQIDDTIYTDSLAGFILVSDTPADTVYAISKSSFAPGVPYSAAVAGNTGFVGRLDPDSGVITPAVTGFQSPHGMGFVKDVDIVDYDSWGIAESYCDVLTVN